MVNSIYNFNGYFLNQFNRFSKNLSGNVMVMAGIMLPVIMLGSALAIEYSMATRLSSKVQNVADAALMAAAIEVRKMEDLDNTVEVEAKLKTQFENFFTANMGTSMPPSFEVSRLDYDPATNRVRTVVSYDYVHSFYRITPGNAATRHDQQVSSEIALTTKSKQPLSMIMVLDKSGSMGSNNRLNSLKTAVDSMTLTLNASDPDEKYVRTGTIFYDTRTSSLSTGWGSDDSNRRVNALSAGGGTDSSLAMKRAVNHLYGNTEEMEHGTRNSGDVRKVILFLTDGNNNRSVSDTKTLKSCDKAKTNDRVEIYTIAFQAPSRGQNLLRNCASSPDHYFNSQNSTDLIAAFEKIAETESGKLAFNK